MNSSNKKYYIIKDKDMAICLKILTQQCPYIYTDKFDNTRCVWSFQNDSSFKEALEIAHNLIQKNKVRRK